MYNTLKKSGRVVPNETKGSTLSNAMVRGVHMMLHEALDSAVGEGLIPINPTEGTTIPKLEKKPKPVLLEEQIEQFMKVIEDDPMWHDFFYTELTTGLRRGEICGLKWTDFDETEGKLNINRSIEIRNGIITAARGVCYLWLLCFIRMSRCDPILPFKDRASWGQLILLLHSVLFRQMPDHRQVDGDGTQEGQQIRGGLGHLNAGKIQK
jgi:hypothetical protein